MLRGDTQCFNDLIFNFDTVSYRASMDNISSWHYITLHSISQLEQIKVISLSILEFYFTPNI